MVRKVYIVGLVAVVASLMACGGSRSQKAVQVSKEASDAETSPNSADTSGDYQNPSDLLNPQPQAGNPGSIGTLDAYRQQQAMLEAWKKQDEQFSFGNMAAQMLPQMLGGMLGGSTGSNPLQGLMSGIQGLNGQPQANPQLIQQQQTYYQPTTAQSPAGPTATLRPDQSQLTITDPLAKSLGAFYQQ